MKRQRRPHLASTAIDGFTLVEVLVSTAIILAIASAAASLFGPAHRAARLQPEISDVQQRLRVAVGMLYADLVMAGAGLHQGPETTRSGPLTQFLAPVLPYRAGRVSSDPARGVFYREDAVTILYVPATAAQSTIAARVDGASNVVVASQPGCPDGDGGCGFDRGMSMLLFDGSTAWDGFEVVDVQGSTLSVTHRGQTFARGYETGSTIAAVEWHTYYFDAAQQQLRHYDGLHTDVPLADNVAAVQFTYFGTADPPAAPRPGPGQDNCVIDAAGVPRLPSLTPAGESLVELSPTILVDGGPGGWCGANDNIFDPDLLRIRRVRVRIVVQAGPGARGVVPDGEIVFDVAPRNLVQPR
jgi:prepilin-type N-terminal cleavage/methylation domain-containing protein